MHPVPPLQAGDATAAVLKDPVCGMTVTAQSQHMLQHEGKPVYFCSAGCKAKFSADPARYSKAATAVGPHATQSPVAESVSAGSIYTCINSRSRKTQFRRL